MTAPVPEMTGETGPWQRYVLRERAARNMYITVTQQAHREYLVGPWPDRDSYQHVEQSAWVTYYAAGRRAWIDYAAELTPPPPPPLPTPYPDGLRPTFTPDDQFEQRQETYLAAEPRRRDDY